MPSALDDAAFLQHQDLVGIDHGGEPMGDDQRRAIGRDFAQALLDFLFGAAVERRCRFVEQHDGRLLQQGARDRHALFFAAGEFQSALAHLRGIAVGQAGDELVQAGEAGRLDHLVLARAGAPVGDVVAQGIVEQDRILGHHADRGAQ